eukprot:scaffold298893_cov32-Tisochrysis_lutea.AAC.2
MKSFLKRWTRSLPLALITLKLLAAIVRAGQKWAWRARRSRERGGVAEREGEREGEGERGGEGEREGARGRGSPRGDKRGGDTGGERRNLYNNRRGHSHSPSCPSHIAHHTSPSGRFNLSHQ